jgi:hypothetical protein
MSDWARNPFLIPPPPPAPVKRRVFISYCHRDQTEAQNFVYMWRNVFSARALGMAYTDDMINSDNADYVMSRIRANYLGDSSVTVLLVGTCTHSRRFIDWELKASLQRGTSTPNGVVGFLLRSAHNKNGRQFPHLPTRFDQNYRQNDNSTYARYWYMPTTEAEMRGYIETAYNTRTTLANNIVNPNDRMMRNIDCKACGVNHGV